MGLNSIDTVGYNAKLKAIMDERSQQHVEAKSHGPMLPGAEDLTNACALVDVELNLNKAIRPLWLDIIRAWAKPGCAAYASWTQANDNLELYAEMRLSGTKPEWGLITRAYNDWQITFKQDADVIYLNSLIDKFIIKGFNGPINPATRFVTTRGTTEFLRSPRSKVKVLPDKAPKLKHAIAFLSWCDHEGINLREVDRERMGADYELVTSGKKPKTNWGRKRKPEINEMARNMGLSFISDKAVYRGAEKWYHARVIRGSNVDAASDYGRLASTFSHQIETFDHITGLR
ncbi:hypothetical protein ACFLWG_00590 [Chloroflexota bacterium]